MYYNKLASQTFFFGLIYYVKKLKTISVIIVFYPSKVKHHNFATHQRYIKSSFCIKHKKGYNFALKAARKKNGQRHVHSNFATWNRGIVGGLDVGSFFFQWSISREWWSRHISPLKSQCVLCFTKAKITFK